MKAKIGMIKILALVFAIIKLVERMLPMKVKKIKKVNITTIKEFLNLSSDFMSFSLQIVINQSIF